MILTVQAYVLVWEMGGESFKIKRIKFALKIISSSAPLEGYSMLTLVRGWAAPGTSFPDCTFIYLSSHVAIIIRGNAITPAWEEKMSVVQLVRSRGDMTAS